MSHDQYKQSQRRHPLSRRLAGILAAVLSVALVVDGAPASAWAEAVDEVIAYEEVVAPDVTEEGDEQPLEVNEADDPVGEAAPEEAPVEMLPDAGEPVADQADAEEEALEDAVVDEQAPTEELPDESQYPDIPGEDAPIDINGPEPGALGASAARQPAIRTMAAIRSFLTSHPFDINAYPTYVTKPNIKAPYAPGKLSNSSIQQMINALNFARYVAGISSNITNDAGLSEYAQAAALVNAANGSMSHTPSKPAGMADALYQKGYKGASSSNIGYGYPSPANYVMLYFDDPGSSNRGVDGHRRWLLCSALGKVGVGHVYQEGSLGFNAMYVFDQSSSDAYTDVAWPARLMPTCLFSDPETDWSLITDVGALGSDASIAVQVVRRRDGKAWNLTQRDSKNGRVYVNRVNYGDGPCVNWWLGGTGAYRDGDVYDVTVKGDRSSKKYSVTFFDIFEQDTMDLRVYHTFDDSKYVEATVGDDLMLVANPGYSKSALLGDSGNLALADRQAGKIITFSSSQKSVGTVKWMGTSSSDEVYYDYDGTSYTKDKCAMLTCVGVGKTTVTASLPNGKKQTIEVEVLPNSDYDMWVSFDGDEDLTYTGEHQHPAFGVYVQDEDGYWSRLTEGDDYSVKYLNDVNAGTGIIDITGIGDYEGGYARERFTINPAPLSEATVASLGNKTYTGSEIKPAPKVTFHGKQLVEGTDYTVSYSANTNVGTAKLTLTGKGNFTGTKTASFKIVAADLSKATLGTLADQRYTGKQVQPKPDVMWNGRRLVEGTDYTISYENNVDRGQASLTVTGKGNFVKSVSMTFNIVDLPTVNIYRLYNHKTSEHLYTRSKGEYDKLPVMTNGDWKQEGVAWMAPSTSAQPVYRLYNLRSGDHHYTTSAGEKASLLKSGDWRDEGIAFYSAARTDSGAVPLYRVYNRRLKRGQHHYTRNAAERDVLVAKHGWRDEGVGFYGLS